ncbi:TetR family transcriptional regulator [Paenibacillus marchantiophytorum]|uniref:TetR family transcriptional regulator n=1 Tax=Paenibacillus marchantiophytorum TaxID=1619310 RepID=A0ABQ1EWG6_9BACL|nr:TetR/AcrR family transcriptional regulator [Paenibacillus marchantiophytorum]GFZ90517.1 TetR family transcriptional regulator [Paenibacillus marchantiophytorum]
MNKKQLQSESTKKRVADAARSLFVQKGYKATSIEDIVGATGSSKGNIYYHFKSKEGLFLYLIEEWDREWEAQWKEKESLYPTTTEKMFGIAEQMVLEDLNHPLTKAANEFFNNEEKASDVEERITELVNGHLKFYETLIQQGIDSGEFKQSNVKGLSVIFESLTMGLSQMSQKLSQKDALALYRLAIQVFLNGITENRS